MRSYGISGDRHGRIRPQGERYDTRPCREIDSAGVSLVWLAEEAGSSRTMTTDRRTVSRDRFADGRHFELL
jgi:hypothetical protein